MTEAWFSPESAFYFVGASCLGLTALAAPAIIKGRHKAIVLSMWGGIIGIGLLLLAGGVLAVLVSQPNHVTAPLVLSGLAMSLGYGFSLIFVLRAYRIAEHRKVAAREL